MPDSLRMMCEVCRELGLWTPVADRRGAALRTDAPPAMREMYEDELPGLWAIENARRACREEALRGEMAQTYRFPKEKKPSPAELLRGRKE